MKKKEFLKQLYQAIYAVGTEEYQRTNLTVEGCPYIAYWFDRYQGKDSRHIERAVRKYVSAPPTVTSAEELINLVAERARKGFKEQVKTGKITEIPEDVPQQEGDGVIPEPEMIIQRKLLGFQPSQSILIPENSKGVLTEKSEKSDVIQRGCVKGGAGGGAAGGGGAGGPVTHTIRDPNWMQVTNADILETSPMGDCWAIIMINGNNRLLAHLPAGDVTQLKGGPAVLNNNYNPGVTQLFLVRGLANQNERAYYMNVKQQLIDDNCAFNYAQLNVIPGFWQHARVDAAGNVTGYN